jgi:arsenate reductase
VEVMAEIGIGIARHRSQSVEAFLSKPFEYVISPCDDAKENCPV